MHQHYMANGLWLIIFSSPNQINHKHYHQDYDFLSIISYQQLLNAFQMDRYQMRNLDQIIIQLLHVFPSNDDVNNGFFFLFANLQLFIESNRITKKIVFFMIFVRDANQMYFV